MHSSLPSLLLLLASKTTHIFAHGDPRYLEVEVLSNVPPNVYPDVYYAIPKLILPTDFESKESDFMDCEKVRAVGVNPKDECITYHKDYWSYSICLTSRITQFHSEQVEISTNQVGTKITSENHLGTFTEEVGGYRLYSGGDYGEECKRGRSVRLNDKCCSEPPQGRNVKKGEMWVKTVNEVEPCSYVIEVCGGEKCVDDSRREVGEAFKILEEEMKGKCLVYSEDWWSYEYCWPGKVKQFHLKGVLENKKVKAVREAVNDISTGRKGEVEVVEGFGRDSGLKEGYGFLRERIEGGSECTEEEISSLGYVTRFGTVEYVCGKEGITSVEEVKTCEYVIKIGVPGLCWVEGFGDEGGDEIWECIEKKEGGGGEVQWKDNRNHIVKEKRGAGENGRE